MRICSIGGCEKKHEAKGYCKVHYRSFMKYGDALHVERTRAESAKIRKAKEQRKIDRILEKAEAARQAALAGHCTAKGCKEPIKTRFLCEKHYARYLRKGNTELTKKQNEVNAEKCLAIGCTNPHARHGFCSTHLINVRENKTPYRPKIIKLCGVKNCENEHMGHGLCQKHYHQWKAIKRDYNLDKYNKLK